LAALSTFAAQVEKKTTPSFDESKDPSAGIMDLMKNMCGAQHGATVCAVLHRLTVLQHTVTDAASSLLMTLFDITVAFRHDVIRATVRYDTGDDEMKRTIAKAWTEGREKRDGDKLGL
jgi:hypothetical protein